ncbi:MAG TPA: type II toxin-antitoxin system HicB family antitoxin [Candidatus Lokiarchaeia archaeon]|nr:type II toxin-antitoxin system HicB family antitoxin [Candidatus Lokiarchaeia archaeon]
MKFKIILEPCDEGGFVAKVPSLPGCISEGDAIEEAIKNIKEAIVLYLDPDEEAISVALLS